jgi:hypothetical protein
MRTRTTTAKEAEDQTAKAQTAEATVVAIAETDRGIDHDPETVVGNGNLINAATTVEIVTPTVEKVVTRRRARPSPSERVITNHAAVQSTALPAETSRSSCPYC